jgi:NADH:ubiquinone oxidoreductase subunit B-like Fe-S oxidoreductase
VDKIIPVDIYVPGCPPRPHAIIEGISKAIEKLALHKSEVAAVSK